MTSFGKPDYVHNDIFAILGILTTDKESFRALKHVGVKTYLAEKKYETEWKTKHAVKADVFFHYYASTSVLCANAKKLYDMHAAGISLDNNITYIDVQHEQDRSTNKRKRKEDHEDRAEDREEEDKEEEHQLKRMKRHYEAEALTTKHHLLLSHAKYLHDPRTLAWITGHCRNDDDTSVYLPKMLELAYTASAATESTDAAFGDAHFGSVIKRIENFPKTTMKLRSQKKAIVKAVEEAAQGGNAASDSQGIASKSSTKKVGWAIKTVKALHQTLQEKNEGIAQLEKEKQALTEVNAALEQVRAKTKKVDEDMADEKQKLLKAETDLIEERKKRKKVEKDRDATIVARDATIAVNEGIIVARDATIVTLTSTFNDMGNELALMRHERAVGADIIRVLQAKQLAATANGGTAAGVHATAEILQALSPDARGLAEKMATLAKQERHLKATHGIADNTRMTSTKRSYFIHVFLYKTAQIIFDAGDMDARKDLINNMLQMHDVIMLRDVGCVGTIERSLRIMLKRIYGMDDMPSLEESLTLSQMYYIIVRIIEYMHLHDHPVPSEGPQVALWIMNLQDFANHNHAETHENFERGVAAYNTKEPNKRPISRARVPRAPVAPRAVRPRGVTAEERNALAMAPTLAPEIPQGAIMAPLMMPTVLPDDVDVTELMEHRARHGRQRGRRMPTLAILD